MNCDVFWKVGFRFFEDLSGLRRLCFFTVALLTSCLGCPSVSYTQEVETVRAVLNRAVDFFRLEVSVNGGYVYQYSADLSKREGEGAVGPHTSWVQPPGTPYVGQAYLQAYQYCNEPQLLSAAREVAEALMLGQLESGGWDNRIEFSPEKRSGYRYRRGDRIDGKFGAISGSGRRNTTTLDDNKSQSACRFLILMDQALNFSDQKIHESALYALDAFIGAQYPNGAWPQRYERPMSLDSKTVKAGSTKLKASLPPKWLRKYPAKKYGSYYTLNDNTICDMIRLMLDAWVVYKNPKYLQSAKRGGEFLILAQLPEPQPGWAQQYDQDMQPAWARKFEPPAITGGESQAVMKTLMTLYQRLAGKEPDAAKYLRPIPRALDYYQRSLLPNGKLARFYELNSNRPLYFNRRYELTYDDDDCPTHYAFVVSSKLDQLRSEYLEIQNKPSGSTLEEISIKTPKRTSELNERVNRVLANISDSGAWIESGRLKYHGEDDNTERVIKSKTFCDNLLILASWLGDGSS